MLQENVEKSIAKHLREANITELGSRIGAAYDKLDLEKLFDQGAFAIINTMDVQQALWTIPDLKRLYTFPIQIDIHCLNKVQQKTIWQKIDNACHEEIPLLDFDNDQAELAKFELLVKSARPVNNAGEDPNDPVFRNMCYVTGEVDFVKTKGAINP